MLLISDANILIDMEVGGLLEAIFRLDETFAVPDVLYSEELEEHHPELPTLGLQVMQLGEGGVSAAMALVQMYSGPSVNDLFALELARENNCPLLIGDRALRKAAEQEGVQLHGILWLVEQMIRNGIVPLERAEQAYKECETGGGGCRGMR
ncbi:DUF3368 domain-containing protein [Thiohalomonas denitrificans]|uniref:DUF3368 domain-containing protein n=1 Tax=Thiohalomonas denitrificans TaxID=415747 RepID=UPI0026ED41FD|nr:DUF3368 domain-containing protein [Thiohalomonas denitrificans]